MCQNVEMSLHIFILLNNTDILTHVARPNRTTLTINSFFFTGGFYRIFKGVIKLKVVKFYRSICQNEGLVKRRNTPLFFQGQFKGQQESPIDSILMAILNVFILRGE